MYPAGSPVLLLVSNVRGAEAAAFSFFLSLKYRIKFPSSSFSQVPVDLFQLVSSVMLELDSGAGCAAEHSHKCSTAALVQLWRSSCLAFQLPGSEDMVLKAIWPRLMLLTPVKGLFSQEANTKIPNK